jgi:hypothetical protein
MSPLRRYTSMTLGEYPKPMVRPVCSRCDRKGQYRKETLLDLYGPDVTMPDLLHLIAKCERHGKLGDPCGIRYGNLLPRDG